MQPARGRDGRQRPSGQYGQCALSGRYRLAIPPDPRKIVGSPPDPPTGDPNVDAPTTVRGADGYGGGIDIRGLGTIESLDSPITGSRSSDGGGGTNIAPAYLNSLPSPIPDLVDLPPGRMTLRDSVVSGNPVAGGAADCARAFSTVTSPRAIFPAVPRGGNRSRTTVARRTRRRCCRAVPRSTARTGAAPPIHAA
ncbi:hypothetical protein ACFYOV_17105 [Streptomyces sp. NPDC005931]|uniref:hypothetical protein n=1 Tax=Streptomyces sp. NPDC005931 TaxID=3364737 RepID=UPI0036A54776